MKLFELYSSLGLDTSEFDKKIDTSTQKGQTMQGKMEGVFKGIKTAITVAGIAMAVKGIGDSFTDAAAAADLVDKSSQKLGLSRTAYQEWGYVLSQNGGNIESFGVAMKTLQTAMVQGTAQTDAALNLLGLSAEKLKNLTPEEALAETIKAFQKMPEGAAKSAAAVDLFGKQGMELLPTLNQASDATDKLKNDAHELGLVLTDEAVDAGVEFGDAMDALKKTVSAAGTTFLTGFMPAITKILNILAPLLANVLPKLGEAFGKIVEKVGPLVETLVNGFAAAITWIADNADTLIPILEGVAGAILLWNGYQAILNITMAANPIGAVITAVGFLAGGLALLNDAFGGTNDGMDRFNAVVDDIANNTTDFSDLVAKMEPNILDVNDLISSTGKTVGELQTTIQEKEDAITAILKSAMKDHRDLRQDELDDIAQYNTDIASLNEELIEQYRSVQIAKLREIQLEAGNMTNEQAAQAEKDAQAAFESSNKKSKEIYDAQIAALWNKYAALGQVDSAAHLKEEQDARAHYQAQLDENKTYYDKVHSILLENSAVLVGAEKKKNADLQMEYQTGLENLNKQIDEWKAFKVALYSNVNRMDSEQAQFEIAASDQWYADKQASLLAAQDAEIRAIENKNALVNSMQTDQDGEVHLYTEQMHQKDLEATYAYYGRELEAAKSAHDAQYDGIYDLYGRVNELESAEAQAELARIEQERQDQTAAWVALYDDKNAAAEAGNAEQMQITQSAFDELKAAQEQYSADIYEIENGALASNNQTSALWLAGMVINNKEKEAVNDQYAGAYADFLANLDQDAWNSFLYQYDVAKQSGVDIPAEYTTMLTNLLATFATMPADMQDEGKAALEGLLSGVENPSLRKDLENEATDTADDVVDAIRKAWDLGSPSRVGAGMGKNFIEGLKGGLEGNRQSLLTVAGSIANDLINAFLSLFGIPISSYNQRKTSYPSHATGLERVPYDGYIAELHKDERVQTKAAAEADRRGETRGIDTASLTSAVTSAIMAALKGVGVYIDGKRAGKLVAAGVSEALSVVSTTRQRRG
jgi:hypothetical protein